MGRALGDLYGKWGGVEDHVLATEDEFRRLLRKHKIEFDERYVWD